MIIFSRELKLTKIILIYRNRIKKKMHDKNYVIKKETRCRSSDFFVNDEISFSTNILKKDRVK